MAVRPSAGGESDPGQSWATQDALLGLLAAAPDAMLAVNASGQIIFMNDQAERLFGWCPDDLLGRPIEVLVPDRFAKGHSALRARYNACPTTRLIGSAMELRGRRRDGSEFPTEISLSSFESGGETVVAVAVRDMTATRRMRMQFEAGPDAIVGVDTSGRIEMVNARAEQLFGSSAGELVGHPLERLVPEAAIDRQFGHWVSQLNHPAGWRSRAGLQLSARRQNGTAFPVEMNLCAVSDEFGPVLLLASFRDVSERIQREAELERRALVARSEQTHWLASLGQLAAGVAHDFNNLLNVVLNFVSLAARRVTDPAILADLDEACAAAERAGGLTRQLLAFAGREAIRLEPLEVNGVVEAVASMLERTLGSHIKLRLDLACGPLIAVTDQHQLEQVVVNLAINARDAMPDGGTITISTERCAPDDAADPGTRSTPDVILRVGDTGHGMSPSVLARAFEPFFTTKPLDQGTGLGLATVHNIAQQSGGEVTIDSAVGAGTTVSVRLRGSASAADIALDDEGVNGAGSERILLVESNSALRWVTARALRERGYDVLVAEDGIEALHVFEREAGRVDLVVAELQAFPLGGEEFAHQLGELHSAPSIIFISEFGPSAASVTARLLAKPVSEHELLSAIREVLGG